ncbi:hypothetical protein EXIGLDRAFT_31661 [Exidia glandulosa HHB12029]|uniref:C3H1-type domain-containing protein n=1 Tax=Exidia glandulosa HHB12029 TaxID=1314781 RepID=A0A165IUE5_EXIGL|nr:hypothetical protein EXIGLDRAFT_31661 [Exidia glandulosa HHB12029]
MAFFQRPQSAAIPIVAPEPRSASSSPGPSMGRPISKKDAAMKHCRNILIYGSCKFEGKGCAYYHPPKAGDVPESPSSPSAQ